MTVQMLPARAQFTHRVLLSCHQQTFSAADQCLGLSEKLVCCVRSPKAYVTVALGVATR